MYRISKALLAIALLATILFSSSIFIPIDTVGYSNQITLSNQQITTRHPLLPNFSADTRKKFAFVSNFESNSIAPWSVLNGSKPKVVSSPNYSGEPALMSTPKNNIPVDYANKGFVAGLSYLTFQVAIDPSPGSNAFFGLGLSNGTFVVLVGVQNGEVVIGSNPSSLEDVEDIPIDSAQPSGWVYLSAIATGTSLYLYVDQSTNYNALISVPSLSTYTGALIETANERAYYTDIVVTSNDIPFSGSTKSYNNMEGYGQGTADNVNLLPEYYNLTAEMTLNNWSIPQNNELSFQINAMNLTGTEKDTCHGFFQLGVDLNNNSYIAPWYVIGTNCGAKYFHTLNGVSTPQGSELVLSIVWSQESSSINFSIDDKSIGDVFSKSIPYSGGGFYSSYTQLEFQPCCNEYAISDYKFQGSLYNMQIVETNNSSEFLPSSYMLPFTLDAPLSWNFNYYVGSEAGYLQQST